MIGGNISKMKRLVFLSSLHSLFFLRVSGAKPRKYNGELHGTKQHKERKRRKRRLGLGREKGRMML